MCHKKKQKNKRWGEKGSDPTSEKKSHRGGRRIPDFVDYTNKMEGGESQMPGRPLAEGGGQLTPGCWEKVKKRGL